MKKIIKSYLLLSFVCLVLLIFTYLVFDNIIWYDRCNCGMGIGYHTCQDCQSVGIDKPTYKYGYIDYEDIKVECNPPDCEYIPLT